jgi:predicted acetyltransferase
MEKRPTRITDQQKLAKTFSEFAVRTKKRQKNPTTVKLDRTPEEWQSVVNEARATTGKEGERT